MNSEIIQYANVMKCAYRSRVEDAPSSASVANCRHDVSSEVLNVGGGSAENDGVGGAVVGRGAGATGVTVPDPPPAADMAAMEATEGGLTTVEGMLSGVGAKTGALLCNMGASGGSEESSGDAAPGDMMVADLTEALVLIERRRMTNEEGGNADR
jgi:hypothetical protein